MELKDKRHKKLPKFRYSRYFPYRKDYDKIAWLTSLSIGNLIWYKIYYLMSFSHQFPKGWMYCSEKFLIFSQVHVLHRKSRDLSNMLLHTNLSAKLVLHALCRDDPRSRKVLALCQVLKLAAKMARDLADNQNNREFENQLSDLHELVTDILYIFHNVICEIMELKIVLSPSLELMKVDPTQIERVIIKLGIKAIEAMPKWRRLTIDTLTISLDKNKNDLKKQSGSRQGYYVTTTVSNTVFGIDSETLKHRLEAFFTNEENRMVTKLGSAINLCISPRAPNHGLCPYCFATDLSKNRNNISLQTPFILLINKDLVRCSKIR